MFRTHRQHPAWLALSSNLFASQSMALAALLLALPLAHARAQQLGLLEGHADVGTVLHPGNTVFDPANNTYTVTGSGDNLWFTADDMQFAWKLVHGDVALTAQIDFVGEKGNNHRKAALMIRQSLAPNSPYADVARHGDGLTSLQFRLAAGDVTREIETPVSAPHWVRIERRGELITVAVGDSPDSLKFSGASMHLHLAGNFYVGLAVCSHDEKLTETAVFRHLQIAPRSAATGTERLWSTLETVKVASSDRRVAYTAPIRLAGPNWSHDGKSVTLASDGLLQRFVLDPAPYPSLNAEQAFSKQPTPVSTGVQAPLDGFQGTSPNGGELAFSAGASRNMHMYVLPESASVAQEVRTSLAAEWHSWSPDGRTLAFTGQNEGKSAIYTTLARGGQEKRLTANDGDQDPEFSPDGEWIYFSSARSGHLQLWRMHPDGGGSEQILTESSNDVNPHPSPDGKSIVYLAMPDLKPSAERMAELRLLSLADRKSHLLATLLVGSGTLPVASWSPDGTRVAFISYAHNP